MTGIPLPPGQQSQYEKGRQGKKLPKSSYPNVIKARQQEIIKQASKGGNLTEQQQTELKDADIVVGTKQYTQTTTTQTPVQVQVNSSQVQQFNEEMKQAGINNSADLLRGLQSGRIRRTPEGNYIITNKSYEQVKVSNNEKPLTTPKSEEYEQTPGQRTISGTGKQPKKIFIDTTREVRGSEQKAFMNPIERGQKIAEELYFSNVQRDNKYRETLTSQGKYVAGSFFTGLVDVGFSFARTFEGNVAQNIFLPYLPSSKGFVAEMIQTVTHPVSSVKQLISSTAENPFRVAGQIYTTKTILAPLNPIEKITIEKMRIPDLKVTRNPANKEMGISASSTFTEAEKFIIKGVNIESKNLGISGTRLNPKLQLYLTNPKYTEFLNKNPLYKAISASEIVYPDEANPIYVTKIIKENGVTKFVKEKVAGEKSPFIEIEETGGTSKPENIYTGGGGGSGGGLEAPGITKSPFSAVGEINKGGGLGSNNKFGDKFGAITAVTSGKNKLILIEPEQTTQTKIISVGELLKSSKELKTTSLTNIYANQKLEATGKSLYNQITTAKSVTKELTTSKLISGQIERNAVINTQTQAQTQKSYLISGNKQASRQRSITTQAQTQVQAQVQVQVQKQAQTQVQAQVQKQITITKTPPIEILRSTKRDESKKSIFGGYNVLVKSKGLFNKINTKPLNLKSALGLGSETVERTPSATFKITNPENPGGIFTRQTPKGFYKKGNLFIEQPSRRINTAGELFGITSKGRTSKRIKKIFG